MIERNKSKASILWQERKDNFDFKHCLYCGMESDQKRCEKCKAMSRKASEARNSRYNKEGLCLKCAKPKEINGTRCLTCLLKQSSKEHTGDRGNYLLLLEIYNKQKGVCFYTGKILIFAENASIDHLYPVSRFPEKANDISNLVWCDYRINRVKRALTYEEFIARCKNIIQVTTLNYAEKRL